jgi:hypothetical protein
MIHLQICPGFPAGTQAFKPKAIRSRQRYQSCLDCHMAQRSKKKSKFFDQFLIGQRPIEIMFASEPVAVVV